MTDQTIETVTPPAYSAGVTYRFSASRINAWMNCPLSAHFRYDENLPREQNAAASFGTAVHAGFEVFNQTGSIDRALEVFVDYWDFPEKYGIEPTWWPKNTSHMSYRKLGIEALKKFAEGLKWDGREVIGTEVPFCVPFGEFELMGFIDLLEVRRNGKGKELLRIVDLKTAGTQPTKAKLALDVQFTTYTYATTCPEFWVGNGELDFPGLPDGQALFERFIDTPRRAIWFHIRTQKEIDAGARVDADFMRLYRVCHEIAKAIEADVHVPKIGDACGLCDFSSQCTMEIPVELGPNPNDPDAWI